MGPNYTCLFFGYVESTMLQENEGTKPELYKWYIYDVIGANR